MPVNISKALRLPPGSVDLASYDPRSTPRVPGGKKKTRTAMSEQAPALSRLQERLYAEGSRSMLLVLQGMDTSGKGGVIRHVVGMLNPQGCQIASFKRPSEDELKHHFLWRVRRQLPRPGFVGVFDRSHYEDVLIARVRGLAEPAAIERRYDEINRFEQRMVDDGTAVVKCFLHISAKTQKERLLARLDNPRKHWKFNPTDVDERRHWSDYTQAYELALERCSTPETPWFVVPSDHKWYRNWAIAQLLVETLTGIDPQYPPVDFDVAEQRRRLVAG
ncbi:MAG: polyphosphate kinase 2 family protein [Geodermatophilaceae bacterium]|nr:polyphosphate kinase 2 family protein [Geodermatophilaceae bacterium]